MGVRALYLLTGNYALLFSGIPAPELTCLEFLPSTGVYVCQTYSQLSLYIHPKLVY